MNELHQQYIFQPIQDLIYLVACSPNTMNPLGLVCANGTLGADGDWNACGGYENRIACPIEETSTKIMCNSGSCESSAADCPDGVRYGSDACESNSKIVKWH